MKRPWRDPKPKRRNPIHRELIENGPRGGKHLSHEEDVRRGSSRKAKHRHQQEDEWWDDYIDEDE